MAASIAFQERGFWLWLVTASVQWAELADGYAGVIGWPFAIDMDDDPGLVGSDTIRWFRYFLAFENTSD